MEDLLQVGAILDTHGLRGEVKVFPTTDDASRYDDLTEVELQKKDGSPASGGRARPLFQKPRDRQIQAFRQYQRHRAVQKV